MTGDIKAAAAAMNKDSARWEEVSGGLKTASSSAANLNIGTWCFPEQANVDLQPLYTQLQDKVSLLLQGGSTETHEVGAELTHVGKILLGTDDAAREKLDGLWDF